MPSEDMQKLRPKLSCRLPAYGHLVHSIEFAREVDGDPSFAREVYGGPSKGDFTASSAEKAQGVADDWTGVLHMPGLDLLCL